MRAVLALLVVPLAGCSNLLGIQDPSTGSGSDGGSDDAGIDAPIVDGDSLKISVSDIKIAKKQRVRMHVTLMHKGGNSEDVTKSSMLQLISSATNIASVGPLTANAVTVDGVAAGTATFTARYSGAADATLSVTVTDTACRPVINEFSTGTAANANNEFVEIYNPCTDPSFSVDQWKLVYRSAGDGADVGPLVTLAGSMAPGDFLVYGGSGYPGQTSGTGWSGTFQQNSGAIGLRDSGGALMSSLSYGSVVGTHPFTETSPAPVMVNDKFAARTAFDGNDSGDNSKDFTVISTSTPGALNVP